MTAQWVKTLVTVCHRQTHIRTHVYVCIFMYLFTCMCSNTYMCMCSNTYMCNLE
jgi:hypothetical protein